MKCSVHSTKDVIGYCVDCGAFGCDDCLASTRGGDSICADCRKKRDATHKQKGFVSKLFGEKKAPEESRKGGAKFGRSSVARKSRGGRKLEVHFRDGSVIKGSTYKLDLNEIGFHLVPIEPVDGKDRLHVNFSDLKAIHIVTDFDGGSVSPQASREVSAEGQEIKVAFPDGKIIEGHTLHRFDVHCQRFFIVPTESSGGSISILVERSALDGIEMDGFREGVYIVSEEAGEGQRKPGERAPLSQSESMGDLYFSMKNYDSALIEYDKIRADYPYDKRLGMKIAVCNFNRGVNFVKSRRYAEAKTEFEKVGEDDPVFEKARRKIKKIDKILKDAEKIGG